MDKKKIIFNAIFFIVLLIVTMYCVFYDQDFHEIITYLKSADTVYWFIGILMVILFILCESVIIYYLFKKVGHKIKLGHCVLFSFIGFFFSSVTPSATGGQPAQIYYMRKDKILMSISSVVLMAVTVTYKMVLVLLGVLVMIFRPAVIMDYLEPVMGWCYLGMAINIICIAAIIIIMFDAKLAHRILNFVFRILCRLRILKNWKKLRTRINTSIEKYQESAQFFRENKSVVFKVFIITCFQRIILWAVTYVVCVSMNIRGQTFIVITVLQGMISLAVDMLPLPGGIGISESLFLQIFEPIFGEVALPVMIVSRGLCYYTQLVVSAVMTLYAHIHFGRLGRKTRRTVRKSN